MFVYGFENADFTSDFNNYNDFVHYKPEINSYFIDSIVAKKHILTPQNLDAYLEECEEQAYNFDLNKFSEDIQSAYKLWNEQKKSK